MTTFIALLRAVNLGPTNKVAMSEIRAALAAAGLVDIRTLLQSGNVVFRSDSETAAELERRLEHTLATELRLTTDVLVRSARAWSSIIAANPFPNEAREDPSHLLVVALKNAPDRSRIAALQSAVVGREVVRVQERCAYIVYPDGIGRSRLTNAVIERALATRGTGRNWNTVLKLASLARGDAQASRRFAVSSPRASK